MLTAPLGQYDRTALPLQAGLVKDDSIISRHSVPACVSARPLCLDCSWPGADTHVQGMRNASEALKEQVALSGGLYGTAGPPHSHKTLIAWSLRL